MGCDGFITMKVLFSCQRSTFRREALWEALGISAVVVNHIVLLHPLNSGLPCCIQ